MSERALGVTRVLVVDDSVLVRRTVTRAFEGEPAIDIVGAVRNGPTAVLKAESLRPDVVILDSVVAATDGFPTLAELRRRQPDLRAVIFSNFSGEARVRWVGPGATSFARKAQPNGIGLSEEQVRTELMPAIRRLGTTSTRGMLRQPHRDGTQPEVHAQAATAPLLLRGVPAVIVIAVSTGGPDALTTVIGGLPAALADPVLVVQHMPPEFTKLLARRLDDHSPLNVVEASAGARVRRGQVYVAPGGHHMELARDGEDVAVRLHDGPRENGCRPAADVLFRSAAKLYRDGVVAVVLTGMGTDGLRGAEAVRAADGWVIAQSETTSVIPSMPGAVAAAGLANEVVRLEHMAEVLTEHVLGGGA